MGLFEFVVKLFVAGSRKETERLEKDVAESKAKFRKLIAARETRIKKAGVEALHDLSYNSISLETGVYQQVIEIPMGDSFDETLEVVEFTRNFYICNPE